MVRVQDEDFPHRVLDDRIDLVRFGRDAERHAQEVARVAEAVLRIHIRDQPVRSDHSLLGVGDIGAVVVE